MIGFRVAEGAENGFRTLDSCQKLIETSCSVDPAKESIKENHYFKFKFKNVNSKREFQITTQRQEQP